MLHTEYRRSGVGVKIYCDMRHDATVLKRLTNLKQFGDATDGYHQGHANIERYEEYGRGEQKHLLEEIGKWSLWRLNRDGMLCCQNVIICRRCIAHCRVGGHAGTEQETSQQSQRKEARVEIEKCEVQWRSTGRRPNKKLRTRRSWIGRSVNCNQENVAEAATHRSLRLGAASTQPTLSNLWQWEPRRHDSSFHSCKGEPTTVYGVQLQPAPGTWARMSQPWKKQEESATRNGGNQRVGNMASRTSGSQLTIPCRLLFWSVLSSPMVAHAKVMGSDFNSPRRGEETRGRQLAVRGDNFM